MPIPHRELAGTKRWNTRSVLGDSEAQASEHLKRLHSSSLSISVLEQIKATIDILSRRHLVQLRQMIDKKLESQRQPPNILSGSRIVGTYTPQDRAQENEWVRQHRDEYAGQWVALDGDRLLAHGFKLKEVVEATKKCGVTDALFIQIEAIDALPWAGF
jgi:hypothetical protein